LLILGLFVAGTGVILPAAGFLIDASTQGTPGPHTRGVAGVLYGLPLAGIGTALILFARSNRRASWPFLAGQISVSAGVVLTAFGSLAYVATLFPEDRPWAVIRWCFATGLPLLGAGIAVCTFFPFRRSPPAPAPSVAGRTDESGLHARALGIFLAGLAIGSASMFLPLFVAGLGPTPAWCNVLSLFLAAVGVALCVASTRIGSR
jgi:hypothetical protein